MKLQDLNIVVIGAGIGGLAAGALLARKGAMVTVLEAQDCAGGCAATFSRNGYRFDAGATIGCGFHTGAPMETLGKELGITWPVVPEAVAWERYTGRDQGCVGGYPQTSLFKVRGPLTRFDNMFLVGDSIFPGQSLPGVVTGARRTVELLLQRNAKVGSQQP